ncbi:MAG: hypothetical protein AB1756_06930 [Acidobacteriota bacterium]
MARQSRFFATFFSIWVFLLALATAYALADNGELPVELHGFLLGNFTGKTSGQSPSGDDFILGEERLRIEISKWFESSSFMVKTDFYHDSLNDEFHINLREAYIDYMYKAFDFRFGRQILTWGIGDLLFINDTFPKDWESFFSSRPLEYLKVGVDSFRARFSSEPINAELVIAPLFESDNLPSPERFYFYDPFPGIAERYNRKPEKTYGNAELAFRLYRRLFDSDVSLYLYRGFWKQPSAMPDDQVSPASITYFYPELNIYGFSVQRSLFAGVIGFEAGYYDSREDDTGMDMLIPNSELRALVAYSRQLWTDFTFGFQYYVEKMQDHDEYVQTLPAGFPVKDEMRQLLTLRLMQFLKYQTWKLSLFTYYSATDEDYYAIADVTKKINDHFAVTFGANILGGKENTTFFGQFDRNDNLFLNLRYDF